MTPGSGLNTGQMLAALIILKEPRLEGKIEVTVRQDRKFGRLYRASRIGQPGAGTSRVRLHWSADLRRRDLQAVLRRAADAAYLVAINATNADALQEVEA